MLERYQNEEHILYPIHNGDALPRDIDGTIACTRGNTYLNLMHINLLNDYCYVRRGKLSQAPDNIEERKR